MVTSIERDCTKDVAAVDGHVFAVVLCLEKKRPYASLQRSTPRVLFPMSILLQTRDFFNAHRVFFLSVSAGMLYFQTMVARALYKNDKSRRNLAAVVIGWMDLLLVASMAVLFFVYWDDLVNPSST